MAGTSGDFETAKDFLKLLQTELGIKAPSTLPLFSAGTPESRNATLNIPSLKEPSVWIDTYYPVMNTPLEHSLEILDEDGKAVWTAELEEVADQTDPEAGKYYDAVTTWHGLSRGGSAKGKLVYANYGRKEDYDALIEQGELLLKMSVTMRSSSARDRRGPERFHRTHALRWYLPRFEGQGRAGPRCCGLSYLLRPARRWNGHC